MLSVGVVLIVGGMDCSVVAVIIPTLTDHLFVYSGVEPFRYLRQSLTLLPFDVSHTVADVGWYVLMAGPCSGPRRGLTRPPSAPIGTLPLSVSVSFPDRCRGTSSIIFMSYFEN